MSDPTKKYKLIAGAAALTHPLTGVRKVYRTGDIMELSTPQAARLSGRISEMVEISRVAGIGEQVGEQDTEIKTSEVDVSYILSLSVKNAEDFISAIDDGEDLNLLRETELAGQNRAGMLKLIDKRVAELGALNT